MIRILLATSLFCTAMACGDESYVLLNIEARCGAVARNCETPDDADSVVVDTFDPNRLELAPIASNEADITGSFPLTISLEIGDATPLALRQRVRLRRGGEVVGESFQSHTWTKGEVTRVDLEVTVEE